MLNELEMAYKTYAGDVYRFLVYFTGDREEAQDLTQEAFIKALNKLNQFNHLSEMKTWIFSIARNLAVDRARKRKRSELIHRILRNEDVTAPNLPEEFASMNERKRALFEAIHSLNSDYRAVTILRGIQGHTPEEAAAILGWTQKRINLTYHRAVKALRTKLTERGLGI